MLSLLIISLLFLAISLGYIYFQRRYTLIINNDLPGSKSSFVLGLDLFKSKLTFHEIMLDYQHRYGDKFVYWLGSHPCIVFCLPEHAQMIFSDRHRFDQSPLFVPNFDLICPSGISTLTGATWKRHARVMLPVLKRAKVIQHLDTIIECTDRFIDQCLNENEIHRDLVHRCQTLTMNVIGLIGFDYDLDSYVHSSSKIAFEDFINHVAAGISMVWLPRWMNKIYLKLNWKYQEIRRQIHDLTEKIVEQEQSNQDTTERQRPKNLIASLVSSLNEHANDEQIASGVTRSEMFDDVLTTIIAGYDTTSTALSWFIFFMSKNPHIQQRIKEELREHNLLLTDDVQYLPSITQENLDALTYCECVTKEVLRLAPASGVTTRMALCDTMVDNVSIRRGQTILIGLHNIHIDARYWHHGDPTKFLPERFFGEDKNHHPYALLPFGGGHRACPGQDLAWLELKGSIVRMMQRGVTFEDTPENIDVYKVIGRFEYFQIIFESRGVLIKQKSVLNAKANFDSNGSLRFPIKNHIEPKKNKNDFLTPRTKDKIRISA